MVGLPGVRSFYPGLRLVPPFVPVQGRLARFQPDVVHVLNPVSLGLGGLLAARQLNRPLVASYHTDLPGFAERWGLGAFKPVMWRYFRWLHNLADLNLCPSRVTQRELWAHGFRRVRVWGRGVDTRLFSPERRDADWRRRLSGGEPGARLLLYVGRLSPEKRVDWLRPLLDVVPELCLAIVGDGPARPALERRFAGTHTMFTGYLTGLDLARAYASADIFAFPAANETLGNVVLEAMASGLPVIAARSGGLLDHVVDGENGLLFSPDDRVDLILAAARLAGDRALARQLGGAGRAHAEACTWETCLDGLLARYQATISLDAERRLRAHRRSAGASRPRLDPAIPER